MFGVAAKITIQIASLVVLARLLQASDYGLVAMVTAVIGVADVLRDFGLSLVAVQRSELSDAARDKLFWINSCIGLVVAVVVCCSAWPLAELYGEPRLTSITLVLSLTFLFNGMGAQHRADLNRRLQFGKLALGDVVGYACGFGVALVLALLGYGYWAIVGQYVTFSSVASCYYLIAAGWLPHRYQRATDIRGELVFGAGVLGVQLSNYVAKNADSVIIGARLGDIPLGLYSRAYQLLDAPMTQLQAPVTKVVLPYLSKALDDPERYRSLILRAQAALLHPMMLMFGVAAGFSPIAIPVMLGDGWLGVERPFQVLCVGGMATIAGYASYWAYLSTATLGSVVRRAILIQGLMVVGFFFGSNLGVEGVAGSFGVGAVVWWLSNTYLLKAVPLAPWRELLLQGAAPFVTNVACALGVLCFLGSSDLGVPTSIALGSLTYCAIYVVLGLGAFRMGGSLRTSLSIVSKVAMVGFQPAPSGR
ncbi:lipopolysaccharide biosynthesis protein [Nocardioides ginsengisegetis]|uniref:lipopolysaccharide biosynthesis protein n=1 Tax=Nocardioides ginsengisegetis TaxID=661491 RepID=UPI001FE2A225|nr:lipopolysaccharide biosynthesis protein [Nocardioides ginsengisegetis]